MASREPFRLRGVLAPAGVPSWPVLPGDTVQTLGGPATISAPDGSRITLGSNSRATVTSNGGGILVRVEQGAAVYSVSPGSKTAVIAQRGASVRRGPPPKAGAGRSGVDPCERGKAPPISRWKKHQPGGPKCEVN